MGKQNILLSYKYIPRRLCSDDRDGVAVQGEAGEGQHREGLPRLQHLGPRPGHVQVPRLILFY